MSDQKTLFMLIGPKGSGKTHIGTLIHQHTDIVFLLAVSDDRVAEFNKIASIVTYDWDLEINNNDPASDQDIINAIQSIYGVECE